MGRTLRDASGVKFVTDDLNARKKKIYNVAEVIADTITTNQFNLPENSEFNFCGAFDASLGTYPASAENQDYYVCNTIGVVNSVSYAIGDWAIYNGEEWYKIHYNTDKYNFLGGYWTTLTKNTTYPPQSLASKWRLALNGSQILESTYLSHEESNTKLNLLQVGWYRIKIQCMLDQVSPSDTYSLNLYKTSTVSLLSTFAKYESDAHGNPSQYLINGEMWVYSDGNDYLCFVLESAAASGFALATDAANYVSVEYSASSELFIKNSEKGNADGVAELDTSGKVPATQLPTHVASIDGNSGVVDLSATYEPIISPKNSAFNKAFGGSGSADSVSRSDHHHNLNNLAEKSFNSLDDKPTIPSQTDVDSNNSHRLDSAIHLSSPQKTALTAGGDSSDHYHGADRNRNNHMGTQVVSSISNFDSSVNARIDSQKAVVNGLASLGVDGKIPTSQMPPLALSEPNVSSSESAQLALTVQKGDTCVRTDLNKSFISMNSTNSSMADWQELLTPTDNVLNVDGQTGTVDLSNDYEGKNSNIQNHISSSENPHNVSHDQMGDVSINQHHNKSHSHDGIDGSGTIREATSSQNGVMSSAYATMLDGIGQVNGIASLDSSGKVPLSQLPEIGSGSDLEIQNEGTSLDVEVSKINFIGAGVEATENIDHEIDVTINKDIDGGSAATVFSSTQNIDGGNA